MTPRTLAPGACALMLAGAVSFGLSGVALADEPSCQGGGQGQYPPGQNAGAHVEDGQDQRGQQETAYSGCDFQSGEDVEYGVESTYQKLGVVKANARGVAAATFTVPTNLSDGRHYVVFKGLSSGKTVRVPFQVQGGTFTGVSGGTGNNQLPRTGSAELVPLALLGGGMVAAGAVTVVAARRRRENSPSALA